MKKILLQVKGTPLIKFQSSDKIESLRKGKIYANTLGYYRKLEEDTGDEEVGDNYEAMIHVNEGIIRIPETGEKIILNDSLIKTSNSDDYVFCMFGIYPDISSFKFTDKQKEKMLSFGDTALIILDSEEFIKRVCIAAEKAGYTAHFGAVQYYDSSVDNGNMILSLVKGMWNIAFWKRKAYIYQQEGRFVFTPGDAKVDHIELDIGDISNITEVIPAKMALTAIVKKNEKWNEKNQEV